MPTFIASVPRCHEHGVAVGRGVGDGIGADHAAGTRLFSTMMVCRGSRRGRLDRARVTSTAPPGGKGTMSLIGLVGRIGRAPPWRQGRNSEEAVKVRVVVFMVERRLVERGKLLHFAASSLPTPRPQEHPMNDTLWIRQAVRRIEADFNRSADTHSSARPARLPGGEHLL